MQRYLIPAIVCVLYIQGLAQQMVIPAVSGANVAVNRGSEILTTEKSATIQAGLLPTDWEVSMINTGPVSHTTVVHEEEFIRLKLEASQRRNHHTTGSDVGKNMRLLSEPPLISHNFRANARDNSVPLDNTMAISENGFIVSGINTNVVFTQPDGSITFSRGLQDFFKLLSLGTRMYDPRVIYDPEQKRFIFMCLHGSDPANTFLCMAFSKTEDPNGEWNYYKIDGNPSGDNNWFDYPNIAVSAHDFYIAGLMRNTDGNWQYSVVYQIDKNDGYNGKPLRWKYYNDLKNADQQPAFNLVPTPSGWNTLLSPGMYFVSNEALGGNKYNLYYTTSSLEGNPSLVSLQTTGLQTSLAPHGRQSGSSNSLNTFDSRIWSAMYLDSVIHMGSHVNTSAGDVGLFYAKLRVNNLAMATDVISLPGQDLAYPSFTAFDEQSTSNQVLVNYLVSGPGKFPGQEQRICRETNGIFEWSEPAIMKEGAGYVDFLSGTEERWGDYTTSCRRFIHGRVESWITGCFGENRSYGTWIGQLLLQRDSVSAAFAEFVADKTTTGRDTAVRFTDVTPVPGSVYKWMFEGGLPEVSTDASPVVKWPQNGAYDVTMIVTNAWGTDTLTKTGYIHIQDPVTPPTADFFYDRDTVYIGDTVRFMQMCSQNTVTYKWTFQQGSPASSTEVNPVVRYNKAGSYLVSLTAANIAGTNTKTKLKAVTVLQRTAPVAGFVADRTSVLPGDTVHFVQNCQGGPVTFEWKFEGGEPTSASGPSASSVYNIAGKYDVQLIVSNDAGLDTLTVDDLITVGISSTSDNRDEDFLVAIYPNPVMGDRLFLNIETHESRILTIDLYDNTGRLAARLYEDKVKQGTNLFSFSVATLKTGTYHLMLSDPGKKVKRLSFVKP